MKTTIFLSDMFNSFLVHLDDVKPYVGSCFRDYCISGMLSLCMSLEIDVTPEVYDLMQVCFEARFK